MSWQSELHRLQTLAADLALLPVGWGAAHKGPMLTAWQKHPGYTVDLLKAVYGIRSVGARTGLHTGPLLAFDFDGASSFDLGLHPWAITTWQVHRDTDPFRLKVLCQPTPEQIAQLPMQPDGSVEFQGKTLTAPATNGNKGEALEVFFAGGRQVILLGHHPSSGGNYFWPNALGPEAFSAPPDDWWQHALQIAHKQAVPVRTAAKPSTTRKGTTRLNPCPICGRHNGPGGSELWCEKTTDGLILCMPGSTFSAEQRHGPLVIRQVIDGYALVKRTLAETGEVLTFKPHQPKPRNLRPQRPQRRSHAVEVA